FIRRASHRAEDAFHFVLQRIQFPTPCQGIRINARELQGKAGFPRTWLVIDFVGRNARIPVAVFRAHRDPRPIRWFPVIRAKALQNWVSPWISAGYKPKMRAGFIWSALHAGFFSVRGPSQNGDWLR